MQRIEGIETLHRSKYALYLCTTQRVRNVLIGPSAVTGVYRETLATEPRRDYLRADLSKEYAWTSTGQPEPQTMPEYARETMSVYQKRQSRTGKYS